MEIRRYWLRYTATLKEFTSLNKLRTFKFLESDVDNKLVFSHRYGDKDIKPSISTASDSQNSSPGPQSMHEVSVYSSSSTVDMQDVLATTSGSTSINGNTIVMIDDDDMPSMSLLVATDGASGQNVDELLLPDFDFPYIDGLDSDMSQSFQYCPNSQGFESFITEVNCNFLHDLSSVHWLHFFVFPT